MRAFTCGAIALIAAAMSVPSIGAAFAQAGSTGGTIGNREKSIIGGEEQPVARKQPARRASQPPRRGAQAPPLGSFDGNWAGVSVGSCIGRFGWRVQVSNGVISGGATGNIARSGATNGDMVILGKHYLFKGVTRASGTASGTWTARNCSGNWTAVRS
ncbi:hypothetical protein [Bradyrhizobium sp.]|uniref:hypothetical protein n=1 Tax=Bradyrhizobium sp. TaxID=376 RepID=UPI001D32A495|nr:hypothetical protein [Bradyrhizobium sp.]MBI5323107.1 hypothetical protein [Bradyrhizobium sp.]